MLYHVLIFITLTVLLSIKCLAGEEQTVLPLSFSPQGMPAATVEIQGKKIPLAFDTVSDSVALSDKIIKEQHLKVALSDKNKCYHDSTGKEEY